MAVRPDGLQALSPVPVTSLALHPTARIPTNPGIAPRIASKNNRNLAG